MPSYLVTGGLGFVGSHLTSVLLDDPEARVTVVDNLLQQVLPSEEVVGQIIRGRPGALEVLIESVAEFRSTRRFDAIFHLASVVGPAAVLKHAGHIIESVVRDTYTMIRLAQEQGARLVYISTSEVYGGGDHGFCEEDAPRVIRGPASARQEYAAGKLACEVAIFNLCQALKLDAVVLRPFNISGVRQLGQGGFVLPRFVGQAILGLPLTVFGDGRQVRAFTDVRDVAFGIVVASQRGARGEVYNVGNPANRTSIHELAELVVKVTKTSSPIRLVDPATIYGEAYRDAPDKFPTSDRLRALGWEPKWRLPQTIEAVHAWLLDMPLNQMKRVAGLEV
jgi:nucleoside-diphosphate-sugar epimerase